MSEILTAFDHKILAVSTDEKAERIYLRLVLQDGRNWAARLSIDEARRLVATLNEHIECAAVGHDALPEGTYTDGIYAGERKKVCRRCGDEWPTR